MSVLIAGRDTTACTLSWALYELARHPEVVVKLRNELLDTVGPTRTPTYADLKNMSYLKAIVNETLRLYPAVPFNVRRALKDTTLPHGGGPDGNQPIAVLEGTPVAYSTLLMQRRADLYPPVSDKFADPDVFSPERWAHWHPKPHEYIPFNAGPRICIGQQFALTEMTYVLCRLFQRYERVVSHMGDIDGGSPMLKADIVLSPGQGVRVAFWEAQGGDEDMETMRCSWSISLMHHVQLFFSCPCRYPDASPCMQYEQTKPRYVLYFFPKLSRTALPNLLMASFMLSGEADA